MCSLLMKLLEKTPSAGTMNKKGPSKTRERMQAWPQTQSLRPRLPQNVVAGATGFYPHVKQNSRTHGAHPPTYFESLASRNRQTSQPQHGSRNVRRNSTNRPLTPVIPEWMEFSSRDDEAVKIYLKSGLVPPWEKFLENLNQRLVEPSIQKVSNPRKRPLIGNSEVLATSSSPDISLLSPPSSLDQRLVSPLHEEDNSLTLKGILKSQPSVTSRSKSIDQLVENALTSPPTSVSNNKMSPIINTYSTKCADDSNPLTVENPIITIDLIEQPECKRPRSSIKSINTQKPSPKVSDYTFESNGSLENSSLPLVMKETKIINNIDFTSKKQPQLKTKVQPGTTLHSSISKTKTDELTKLTDIPKCKSCSKRIIPLSSVECKPSNQNNIDYKNSLENAEDLVSSASFCSCSRTPDKTVSEPGIKITNGIEDGAIALKNHTLEAVDSKSVQIDVRFDDIIPPTTVSISSESRKNINNMGAENLDMPLIDMNIINKAIENSFEAKVSNVSCSQNYKKELKQETSIMSTELRQIRERVMKKKAAFDENAVKYGIKVCFVKLERMDWTNIYNYIRPSRNSVKRKRRKDGISKESSNISKKNNVESKPHQKTEISVKKAKMLLTGSSAANGEANKDKRLRVLYKEALSKKLSLESSKKAADVERFKGNKIDKLVNNSNESRSLDPLKVSEAELAKLKEKVLLKKQANNFSKKKTNTTITQDKCISKPSKLSLPFQKNLSPSILKRITLSPPYLNDKSSKSTVKSYQKGEIVPLGSLNSFESKKSFLKPLQTLKPKKSPPHSSTASLQPIEAHDNITGSSFFTKPTSRTAGNQQLKERTLERRKDGSCIIRGGKQDSTRQKNILKGLLNSSLSDVDRRILAPLDAKHNVGQETGGRCQETKTDTNQDTKLSYREKGISTRKETIIVDSDCIQHIPIPPTSHSPADSPSGPLYKLSVIDSKSPDSPPDCPLVQPICQVDLSQMIMKPIYFSCVHCKMIYSSPDNLASHSFLCPANSVTKT